MIRFAIFGLCFAQVLVSVPVLAKTLVVSDIDDTLR